MIPVSRPLITRDDINFVKEEALKKGYVAQSHLVKDFENIIKKYLNCKYAVSTNNGSSALIAAIAALELKKNSTILVPNCTIISVLNAVIVNGHKPVFIDVDEKNWNISFELVKKKVKEKKIDAAIIVENYNSSPHMNLVCKYLKNKKIKIIEDASESLGGSYQNKKFGSFGDIVTLSFFANKIITTGEGGMVLSNNKKYSNFFEKYINLFFSKNRDFKHQEIGYNFRMNSMSAALGITQFNKIEYFLNIRKKIYERYMNGLNWGKFTTQEILEQMKSSYWVFPILNKNLSSKKMINILKQKKIQSRHIFFPLSEQTFIKKKEKLNVSRFLFDHGIYLPMGNGLKMNEIDYTIKVINSNL